MNDIPGLIATLGPKLYPLLLMYLLVYARMATIVAITPFFAAKLVPGPVKVILALAFAAILFPQYLNRPIHLEWGWSLMGLLVKEVLVGAVLGFLAGIPFQIAQSAGVIIDHQREASSLQVMDPTIGEQTSPLGILYNNVLLALFFTFQGPFLFLNAVATSFQILPPDETLPMAVIQAHGATWTFFMGLTNFTLAMSTQLAGPALVSLLLADLFLGIANRLAPQVQISFLGMGLKSLFGLGALFLAWFFLVKVMTTATGDWMRGLTPLLEKIL
jgi:type III secretion protein SpaR/YscT/HrcT